MGAVDLAKHTKNEKRHQLTWILVALQEYIIYIYTYYIYVYLHTWAYVPFMCNAPNICQERCEPSVWDRIKNNLIGILAPFAPTKWVTNYNVYEYVNKKFIFSAVNLLWGNPNSQQKWTVLHIFFVRLDQLLNERLKDRWLMKEWQLCDASAMKYLCNMPSPCPVQV